jgi:transcriptional regulator with XRE-family HTH domain
MNQILEDGVLAADIGSSRYIGPNLRKYRCNLGLTQGQLAKMLSLSVTAVSHYENGTRIPDIDILIFLARVLRIQVTDLLVATDMAFEA